VLDVSDRAHHAADLVPSEHDDGVRHTHDLAAGMIVHGGIRQAQDLGSQTQVFEDYAHQFDGIAIQVHRSEHDLIGVIAEGRDALAVEDPVHADLQLFLARQALGSHELEGSADDIPPLVYLFGFSGNCMNVLHYPARGEVSWLKPRRL
jgi:hypothetical protein